MRCLLLALGVWCAASGAHALEPDAHVFDEGSPEHVRDLPPRHSLLVPALEVPAINLTIWAFNRYALEADYAFISGESIARNLRGTWTYDQDSFEVNQFGHPYQGALSFTAARSAGVDFWWSTLFPFFGSLMWELAMEVDPPSINDQITTPIAGALVGEAMHRMSSALLFGDGGNLFKRILAVIVNPMRALNGGLFGLSAKDDDRPPPLVIGHLMAGLTLRSAVLDADGTREELDRVRRMLTVGIRLFHGLPGDRSLRPRVPFDHFDLSAELNISAKPVAQLAVHGLLWGGAWGEGQEFRGLGGVYAFYDFANPEPFRVSTVALGGGTTMGWTLGGRVPFFVTVATGLVPMGAAGASLSEDDTRGYHVGPGNMSLVSFIAQVPGVGYAMLGARQTTLVGVRDQPGWESITRVEASIEARFIGCQGLGLKWTWNERHAGFERGIADVTQRGATLRVHWAMRLGAFARQVCEDVDDG